LAEATRELREVHEWHTTAKDPRTWRAGVQALALTLAACSAEPCGLPQGLQPLAERWLISLLQQAVRRRAGA